MHFNKLGLSRSHFFHYRADAVFRNVYNKSFDRLQLPAVFVLLEKHPRS